jgi:hypothetical protein
MGVAVVFDEDDDEEESDIDEVREEDEDDDEVRTAHNIERDDTDMLHIIGWRRYPSQHGHARERIHGR